MHSANNSILQDLETRLNRGKIHFKQIYEYPEATDSLVVNPHYPVQPINCIINIRKMKHLRPQLLEHYTVNPAICGEALGCRPMSNGQRYAVSPAFDPVAHEKTIPIPLDDDASKEDIMKQLQKSDWSRTVVIILDRVRANNVHIMAVPGKLPVPGNDPKQPLLVVARQRTKSVTDEALGIPEEFFHQMEGENKMGLSLLIVISDTVATNLRIFPQYLKPTEKCQATYTCLESSSCPECPSPEPCPECPQCDCSKKETSAMWSAIWWIIFMSLAGYLVFDIIRDQLNAQKAAQAQVVSSKN